MYPENAQHNESHGFDDVRNTQKTPTPLRSRRRPLRQFDRVYPEEYTYRGPPHYTRPYYPPYRGERMERPYGYSGPKLYPPPYRMDRMPFHDYRSLDRPWGGSPYEDVRIRPNWRKRRPYPTEQTPVNVLGLFGLDIKLSEKDLSEWIKKHLSPDLAFSKVELVVDRHTGFSRGFAFVYFSTVEDATKAKEQLNSQLCNGTPIRVEYSITATGHRKEEEQKPIPVPPQKEKEKEEEE